MEIDTREFIKMLAAGGAGVVGGAVLGGCAASGVPARAPDTGFRWIYLAHFGCRMWGDLPRSPEEMRKSRMFSVLTEAEADAALAPGQLARDRMHFDLPLWKDLTAKLRACGCNTIMLDVGEGLAYPSHPELAVRGSWSPDALRAEVGRLRAMGFEVIPKLNFSTAHDAWLGPYGNMVSTPRYYEVCADVIRDVMEVFAPARDFHIGFDEEHEPVFHRTSSLLVIRQGDLWWHDLNWFVREVERHGARAWTWSDYIRRHPVAEFCRRMPRTVVQNPWTYVAVKSRMAEDPLVKIFGTLAEAGYDVAPAGSNCYGVTENFPDMADYCAETLPAARYKGIIMAPWFKTIEPFRRLHWQAADLLAEAVRRRA